MPLSKTVTHGDFFSRVENRCKNNEKFDMDKGRIVVIIRNTITTIFTTASASMEKYYRARKDIAVAGGIINLATENVFDVLELSYGMTKLYRRCENITNFIRDQEATAHETKDTASYWYWMPGTQELLVKAPTAETPLRLWYVRYPEVLTITEDTVAAKLLYIDLPDWIIPLAENYASIECLKEKNLEIPNGLSADTQNQITAISDKLAQNELTAMKLNLDSSAR